MMKIKRLGKKHRFAPQRFGPMFVFSAKKTQGKEKLRNMVKLSGTLVESVVESVVESAVGSVVSSISMVCSVFFSVVFLLVFHF